MNERCFKAQLASADNRYRYRLDRTWDIALPRAAWICLNPSTADDVKDDATTRKIAGFSARWGFGGFSLFNILALRSTHPAALLKDADPRGRDNEPEWIAGQCTGVSATTAIVAWGNIHPRFRPHALAVLHALDCYRYLGRTKSGQPRHPLRLPYATRLDVGWVGSAAEGGYGL